MKKLLLISWIVVVFSACTSNNKQEQSSDAIEQETTQFYQYQRAFTKLTWTAYKTTAKLGVSGTFKDFNVTPGVDYGTIDALLNQLEFSIPVASTNSENEERDGKIVASFFGPMMNTEHITGKFTSVAGNDSAGSIRIMVKMNDLEHEISGSYVTIGNKIEIKTTLHLGDWKAEPSVNALNKVCDDLHKGDDGVSKLWPEIDLVIESSFKPVSRAI